MNFTLLITVLVTALTLVVAAYVVAKLIGPRSYAKVKGEPYESGIPTRGSSWLPVSVGFYLFAILFLMFDIEHTLGGKETWNGSKKASHQEYSLRGVE